MPKHILKEYDNYTLMECLKFAYRKARRKKPNGFISMNMIISEFYSIYEGSVPRWYLRSFIGVPNFTLDEKRGWVKC